VNTALFDEVRGQCAGVGRDGKSSKLSALSAVLFV
jgi:hypothetical protein